SRSTAAPPRCELPTGEGRQAAMFVPLTPLAFYRRAEELFGRKVGVVDGEARFTYADFAGRVDRLSGALRGLGVGSSDVVSFLTFNSHQLLEGYYAVPQ